jgi:hypothetical protein
MNFTEWLRLKEETSKDRWQRKKKKHPKDYNRGKQGYFGGNPRYGKGGNRGLEDMRPDKNRNFQYGDEENV